MREKKLKNGERLSNIVNDIAKAFKIKPKILIPTDDRVQTRVKTKKGWISFQEYFVREKCRPKVLSLKYQGIEKASPTKEALEALENADLIVLAPSNPLLSIAPILEIKGIKDKLKRCNAPIISISPLIAGKAIKGPTVEIMKSLGLKTNSIGVAELFHAATAVGGYNYRYLEPYTMVGIIFLILSIPAAMWVRKLERTVNVAQGKIK